MDPLTHGLIGIGVSALTGQAFSLSNPLHLGAVIGAVAPDFDIVLQLFGDLPYLKHHRGFSHSIPGLLVMSSLISLLIWLFLGGSAMAIFSWTFLGALSHIILDILNSYGAQILWPFSKKKYTLNLLVVADPVIITVFAGVLMWPGMPGVVTELGFWLALFYLGIRLYMRETVKGLLQLRYETWGIKKIVIMPAMISLWDWAFLLETDDSFIVGELRCFSKYPKVKKILQKNPDHQLVHQALESRLGDLFRNFTPYFHIYHCVENGHDVVRFCDLRYFFRQDFLHNATMIFDEAQNVVEAVFQPYSKKRKISIMG